MLGGIAMKSIDKLRANWKNGDVMLYYPVGIDTKSDAHWLANRLFGDNFIRQCQERGYDISTFKFEISPTRDNEKFKSQRSLTSAGADADLCSK
jgi:hypothetical protein